jgi:two-component system, LytTR family, sensor histidine kinase AlgZ
MSNSSRMQSRLPISLSWLGLLFVLVLVAVAIAAVLADHQEIRFTHVVLLTFVCVCYAGSYIAIHKLLVERLETRIRGWQVLLLRSVALILAVLIGTELAARGFWFLGTSLEESRRNFFPVGLSVTAAGAILDYGYQQLRRRAREFELREERARRKAIMAELSALRARTDPHFLFNSLNTIVGLIEEDPKKATDVVERLAGLFRYALDGSRRETAPLATEIRAVEAYLEIEAIRLGERFRWQLHVEPGLLDLEVPTLFLLPVVENAVMHGVAPKRGEGRVTVRATSHEGRLRLEVRDDGAGMGNSTVEGSGSSMNDLRERLDLLYGENASLSIADGDSGAGSGGVVVTIEIPIGKESIS